MTCLSNSKYSLLFGNWTFYLSHSIHFSIQIALVPAITNFRLYCRIMNNWCIFLEYGHHLFHTACVVPNMLLGKTNGFERRIINHRKKYLKTNFESCRLYSKVRSATHSQTFMGIHLEAFRRYPSSCPRLDLSHRLSAPSPWALPGCPDTTGESRPANSFCVRATFWLK